MSLTLTVQVSALVYSAPSLSITAQVVLMTSFLTLAIKMTGNRPARFNIGMPGDLGEEEGGGDLLILGHHADQ